MTRVFSEGFEMGDLKLWDTVSGGSISTDARSGTYSGFLAGGHYLVKNIDEISEGFIRVCSKQAFRGTSPNFGLEIRNSDSELIRIHQPDTIGYLKIYIGGVYVGQGSIAITDGIWRIIELHFKIHDTEGIVEVKVNGRLDGTYYGNTKPGEQTGIDQVWFRNMDTHSQHYSSMWIDDIGVNNTLGEVDNSWCGSGAILCIVPNGSGDNSDLVGSDGDSINNFELVDERPSDTATYVEGEVVGSYDLYNFAAHAVPEKNIIKRVWIESTLKDPDGGDINHVLKTHDTEYEDDADTFAGLTFDRTQSKEYLLNPNTGEEWTSEELNSIQAGIKVKS